MRVRVSPPVPTKEIMDSDNVFIKAAAAVIITIVLSATSCSAYKTAKITEATLHGTDPMRIACAISSDSRDATCVILAMPTK